MNLADRTFTYISLRVQPLQVGLVMRRSDYRDSLSNESHSMIGLGWLTYVRTDYRDSANNESHQIFDCSLYPCWQIL
jgi:hypothetical protein